MLLLLFDFICAQVISLVFVLIRWCYIVIVSCSSRDALAVPATEYAPPRYGIIYPNMHV